MKKHASRIFLINIHSIRKIKTTNLYAFEKTQEIDLYRYKGYFYYVSRLFHLREKLGYNIPYPVHVELGILFIQCPASDPVLHEVEVQAPVHALYRPVIADDRSKHWCICRQTAYIQSPFMCLCPRRLPDRLPLTG